VLVIARETLARFWPEAEPLMRAHCAEVKACTAEEFSFDLPQAKALEGAGALLIATARESGRLIGYCVWFITKSLITCQKIALQSGWYIDPSRREGTLALELFRRSLAWLRQSGAVECYPHFWNDSPPRLSSFFSRLGARPAEIVYRMKL
jgi:hypothetical protein